VNLTTGPISISRQREYASQFSQNLGIIQVGSTFLGDDDDILRGQNSLVVPEKFPQ
jgi:hypothetical protein